MDVLAWNPMAAALITDFGALPAGRRNLLWRAFCDPAARSLYVDWEQVARQGIAHLRLSAARHPDDPGIAALVGEPSVKSEEFRTWWARRPDQHLITYTAPKGSPATGEQHLARLQEVAISAL